MKIQFHYTYLIMALGFILSGYITNLLIFTSIILVHELGHFIMAKINKFKVEKIIIYPYGGLTKLHISLNENINKELSVAISGIIMQLIFYKFISYLYQDNYIREYIFNLFNTYNRNILIFNILPIIPLDGSKILNLFLYKVFPYKLSNKIVVYISYITLIIALMFNYYELNYTMFLTLGVIVSNISNYYNSITYLFNRFILERYLCNYHYKNSKIINKIDNMYKDNNHIFHINKKYVQEKEYLNKLFLKK